MASGYVVEGLARIDAAPHRSDRVALAIAARVSLHPSYLGVLLAMVAGVVDLRKAATHG